ISGLPVLENIFLADTAITDNGVLQLTHLKNLRLVSLFGTNVTINGMFLLQSALPKLDVRWDGKDLEPRAARDLIAIGAEISLQTTVDDNLLKVGNPGDLPQGHFRIKIVDLSGNPKVDNRDLEPLTSLAHVVEIRLDGTSVTNDGVAGLAEIKSLRKIDLGALQIAPGPIALIKRQLPGIAIVEKQTDLWKTANWVLAQRGNVTVRLPDGRELSGIVDPLQLPKGEFTLTEIHLVDNPQIVDADLENVRGISQLKVLNISGSGVTDRGIVHVIGCTQLRDLDLSRTKITDVAASLLARIQSLRQLYVAGTDISGDGLEHLKSVGELTHLSLAKTKIQDDDLLWLKGLQNLRWLSLSGTGITDAARSSFDKLKTLKELHVDGSHITDAGLEELRRRIPHCETIVGDEPDKQRSALVWVVTREGVGVIAGKDGDVEIRDRAQLPRDACRLLSIDLRGVDVMGLNFLDGCTDLKVLDLTDTEVGSRAFSAVGDLSSLTHLFLADTPVLERGLEPLSRLGNLEVLDLSGRRISGVGLGFLDGLTELRGLELENCQLTNEALSDLGRHGGLESLTLNKNLLISDQAVAQLSGLKNLKSLELANTSVTDAALEHIAGFKKLQVLNLAGATKIADADGLLGRLPAIRWIRLRGTKVGDATLKALESSKSVTYVDVVGTEVSEAAVTELKKANPRIQ
ncbi:MAG: hypothetical protein VX257_03415, partial [Planctomycetota bacterium]|nr:hypothetical protein [Planctomycetota bacterium]